MAQRSADAEGRARVDVVDVVGVDLGAAPARRAARVVGVRRKAQAKAAGHAEVAVADSGLPAGRQRAQPRRAARAAGAAQACEPAGSGEALALAAALCRCEPAQVLLVMVVAQRAVHAVLHRDDVLSDDGVGELAVLGCRREALVVDEAMPMLREAVCVRPLEG